MWYNQGTQEEERTQWLQKKCKKFEKTIDKLK
jgi:hypothetical protein